METGAIYFARHQDTYVFKFTGEVCFQQGCAFDDFLKRLFACEDFNDILVDLTQTRLIDSTNLGLLAKIANYIRRRFNRKVTVFSTNEDINQILDSVGFFSVFNICNWNPLKTEDDKQAIICPADQSHLATTLYEAHLILSELNEKNREMFRNVVEELQAKACSS